jgi:hypothetical protein
MYATRMSSSRPDPFGARTVVFWTVIGTICALVGIVLAFRSVDLTPNAHGGRPATAPLAATAQAIVPARSGAPIVRHQGPGTIVNRGTGLDLDSLDADWGGPTASGAEVDIYIDTCCTGAPINGGSLVKVTGRPIAYHTCVTASGYAHSLLTLEHDDARPGDRYCLLTSEGRYSAIQIRSATKIRGADHDLQWGTVAVTAVTWEKRRA